MKQVEVDVSDIRAFFEKLRKAANGDFEKELNTFLDGIGQEFLRIVEDNIVSRHRNTGNGLLISSFHKGAKDNVWELRDGGLTLEVGTNVEYAAYVNDGHMTFDPARTRHFTLPNGDLARFVPGRWISSKRFEYDPSAKSGMILKLHFVEGIHYWEPSVEAIKDIMEEACARKMEEWLDSYFGG